MGLYLNPWISYVMPEPPPRNRDLVLAKQLCELRFDNDCLDREVETTAFPELGEPIGDRRRSEKLVSGLLRAILRQHAQEISGVVSGLSAAALVDGLHPL